MIDGGWNMPDRYLAHSSPGLLEIGYFAIL